jgi:uncharacterized protein with von Willebrand factor type A (vWA) domain
LSPKERKMNPVKILAKYWSEKDNIKVVWGNKAQTDGERVIYLPKEFANSTNPVLLTTLLHESYHISNHTKNLFKRVIKTLEEKNAINNRWIIHSLFNILEDVRIDTLAMKRYKVKSFYQSAIDELFKKGQINNKELLHALLSEAMILAEGLNLPVSVVPPEAIPVRDKVVEILKKAGQLPKKGIAPKMAEYIEELKNVLKEFIKNPPQPEEETSSRNKQQEEDQDQQGNAPENNQEQPRGDFPVQTKEDPDQTNNNNTDTENQEDTPPEEDTNPENTEKDNQEDDTEEDGREQDDTEKEPEDTEAEGTDDTEEQNKDDQDENITEKPEDTEAEGTDDTEEQNKDDQDENITEKPEDTEAEGTDDTEEQNKDDQDENITEKPEDTENAEDTEKPEEITDEEAEYELGKELKKFRKLLGIEKLEELLKDEINKPREVKLSPMILKRILLKKIENRGGQVKINLKKISKIYVNPEKIFYNPVPTTKRTTLYLLVDRSGSMGGIKMQTANECVYNIVKAGITIPRLDIKVIYWDDNPMFVPVKNILKLHFPGANGNTYPVRAIELVEKDNATNKEVIYITDGEWFWEDVEKIKTQYQQKYHIRGILIEEYEQKYIEYFTKHLGFVRIEDIEELPEALLRLL